MSNSFLPGSIAPIRPAGPADATWIADFLRDRWNATTIALHGEVIEAAELPALIAGDRQGLATYRALGRDAELVTLDAMPTATGTGTALIQALATRLQGEGCERLWLTTTNDKLSALRFYMRRGFRVIQARPGAVDAARKLKPTIPVIGEHGIPVQEEIDLAASSPPTQQRISWPGRRGARSHPGGRKYAMTVKKADKARNPT